MDLIPDNPFRSIGKLIPSGGLDFLTNLLPNTRPKSKSGGKDSGAMLLNNKGQEDYTPSATRTSSIVDNPPLKSDPTKVNSSSSKKTVDPLLSQLQFFQLIAPFLQQTIQQATSGLQSTAQQYEQDMGSVVSNMPESLQSLYGGVVPGVTNALNNQAAASAQSATAQPEYSFMMGLIESLRSQQEQAMQQQMMIEQLQRQLAQGGADDSGLDGFIKSAVADAFQQRGQTSPRKPVT